MDVDEIEAIGLILEAILVQPTPNTPGEYIDDEITYAYEQFMRLVEERLGGEPDKQDMIDRYLEAPDIWEGVVSDGLLYAGIGRDEEVIEAARELLQLTGPLDPEGEGEGQPEIFQLPTNLPGLVEEEGFEEES
ncbi:MAG: hypothetical protein L0332_25695 [Chloroflexi bacterium]|nr:hypothetical protein [Chloroflexota bacterium]MCI0577472.1 hypothetical protein [Chloroflexota bacterium]MCI0647663.1 hypothetical protein [Chloroflexota bacterium]MCI0730093.1 hypothetical protein [Chloroflexota bacterium]